MKQKGKFQSIISNFDAISYLFHNFKNFINFFRVSYYKLGTNIAPISSDYFVSKSRISVAIVVMHITEKSFLPS